MHSLIQNLSDKSGISYQQAKSVFEKVTTAVLKNTDEIKRPMLMSALPVEITERLTDSEISEPIGKNVSYKQVYEEVNNDLNLKQISNPKRVVSQAVRIFEDYTGLDNLFIKV